MSDIRVASVKVGERVRADLGDLDALVASIQDVGLLQPIVVDNNLNLVAGYRRLEAAKRLGWPTIPARVVAGLDDALKALHAERDENTCRKDFTPSELVAMGRAIEAVEAPKAAERERSNLRNSSVVSRDTTEDFGRTRDKVGKALGVSGGTYARAASVVSAAENPADPGHAEAVAARDAMDAGDIGIKQAASLVASARRKAAVDKVMGGNDRSREAVQRRRDQLRELAARGYDRTQIAKELGIREDSVSVIAKEIGVAVYAPGTKRKVNANKVMENVSNDLVMQMETALSLLEGRYVALDPEKVESWVASLENARKLLNRLMSNIKEITRA